MKNTTQNVSQTLGQKIKAALHVYTKSLTSVKYYKELIKTDLKFSLKYYVVLAVLFTLVNALFSTIQILPKLQKGIRDTMEYALNMYEDDLIITIKGGALSVNKEEPYIIPLASVEGSSEVAKNLIVFDSKAGLDDLEETYDALILVNGTNVLMRSSSKTEVFPIKDIPDATITKEDFSSAIAKIQSLTKFVPYFVGIAFVLAMLFYYLVYRLIYLFFVGVLLWVIGAIRGLNLSFSKFYKVALHTMSLPLTVGLVNSVVSANIYFPSWFFLLNIIFGGLVVVSLDLRDVNEDALEESDSDFGNREEITAEEDLNSETESKTPEESEVLDGEVL